MKIVKKMWRKCEENVKKMWRKCEENVKKMWVKRVWDEDMLVYNVKIIRWYMRIPGVKEWNLKPTTDGPLSISAVAVVLSLAGTTSINLSFKGDESIVITTLCAPRLWGVKVTILTFG